MAEKGWIQSFKLDKGLDPEVKMALLCLFLPDLDLDVALTAVHLIALKRQAVTYEIAKKVAVAAKRLILELWKSDKFAAVDQPTKRLIIDLVRLGVVNPILDVIRSDQFPIFVQEQMVAAIFNQDVPKESLSYPEKVSVMIAGLSSDSEEVANSAAKHSSKCERGAIELFEALRATADSEAHGDKVTANALRTIGELEYVEPGLKSQVEAFLMQRQHIQAGRIALHKFKHKNG